MKILINPEWIGFIKDLSIKQKAELLMCLLSYPNGESKIGAWGFIKQQIDRDAEKYQERCKNLEINRQKRWANNQTDNRNETDAQQTSARSTPDEPQKAPESVGKSNSIESENDIEKEKSIENRKMVGAMIRGLARGFDPDAPTRYEITDDLNFYDVEEIRDSLWQYTDEKLRKARRSLIDKRDGQKLTGKQILSWISNEGSF